MNRQRLSMRAIILVLALVHLSSCGPSPTPTPAHEAPSPQPTATSTQAPTAIPTVEATPEGLGRNWTRPADGMVMVYVPGGTFQMGSTDAEVDAAFAQCVQDLGSNKCYGHFESESPQHAVTLDGFWIDQTEVSVAQFRQFVAETGYETDAEQKGWGYVHTQMGWAHTNDADWQHPQGSDNNVQDGHPVVQVSWNDAVAYCEWTGARLPTEAEWEYAARGQEGRLLPWGDTFEGTRSNYCDVNCEFDWADEAADDGYARTAPVGSFPSGASWCGAQDMAGNVWEWVADWIGEYSAEAQTNPTGPETGAYKVLRGGTAIGYRLEVRSVFRIARSPDDRHEGLGFRCVVTAPGE